MYLLANGLEHAKTACFSSYKTDWLHDNWVMRRQNGFLHSLHFFATGRLIALLFWQLGRLRMIKKKALLDFLRWLARQKTHKTLSFNSRWKQFCFYSRRVSCGSRQSSILFEPLSTTHKYDGQCRTWAIMPTFNARKRKDYTEVFQAGKRLSGSEYVCQCVCRFWVCWRGDFLKQSEGSDPGTRRSEGVK